MTLVDEEEILDATIDPEREESSDDEQNPVNGLIPGSMDPEDQIKLESQLDPDILMAPTKEELEIEEKERALDEEIKRMTQAKEAITAGGSVEAIKEEEEESEEQFDEETLKDDEGDFIIFKECS